MRRSPGFHGESGAKAKPPASLTAIRSSRLSPRGVEAVAHQHRHQPVLAEEAEGQAQPGAAEGHEAAAAQRIEVAGHFAVVAQFGAERLARTAGHGQGGAGLRLGLGGEAFGEAGEAARFDPHVAVREDMEIRAFRRDLVDVGVPGIRLVAAADHHGYHRKALRPVGAHHRFGRVRAAIDQDMDRDRAFRRAAADRIERRGDTAFLVVGEDRHGNDRKRHRCNAPRNQVDSRAQGRRPGKSRRVRTGRA
jgi:hypothetical protein